MTLSRLKLATSLPLFAKFQNKVPDSININKTNINKIAVTVGLCFGLSSWAQAQLPPAVESALNKTNISSDDISLIIMPVTTDGNGTSSNLPKVVKPEVVKTLKPSSEHDADALPPEQTPTAEIIISSQSTTQSTHTGSESTNQPPKSATSDSNNTAQNSSNNVGQSETTEPSYKKPLQLPIRHLADLPRTPASTMKLIPTFVALDSLGPDFVWFTKVYHTGYVSANTLYGDLIIKGSGDPKLTSQRLNKLLEQVQQAGIKHIKGDIVLDSSVFQNVTKDPAAFDNDPLRPYNASPDGLLVNFSTVAVTSIPVLNQDSQGLSKLYYKPRLADYSLPNTIPMASSGACRSARLTLSPTWLTEGLKFNKALPESCASHTFYIAYPSAKEFAKKVVKDQWQNLGNSITGNVKFLGLGNTVSGDIINTENPIKTNYGSYLDMNADPEKNSNSPFTLSALPSSPLPFTSYPSLPLAQQIYDINHYSNNVMTEQLALTLPLHTQSNIQDATANPAQSPAVIKSIKNQQSDYQQALSFINQWWDKNLTTLPPVMTNGSGLCRDCTVTAENLAELLSYAYQHKDFDTYVNSLGIAGISGTIEEHAKRLPTSEAIGRAWIKTGTLNNVTSMAGYVNGQSGQDYVVVGIINGSDPNQPINTYQARYVLDTMLDWTAKQ